MNGKIIETVVFLVTKNIYTGRAEAIAYFPNTKWDSFGKDCASYMHNGQHGPCCEAFALLDCHPAKARNDYAVVRNLQKELESMGYVLNILDAEKWYAEKHGRKAELSRNVEEASNITDSEAQLNVNKTRAANAAARATA